jgi:hypothetical protein
LRRISRPQLSFPPSVLEMSGEQRAAGTMSWPEVVPLYLFRRGGNYHAI